MKSLRIEKIFHHGAYRIGVFFDKDFDIIAVLKRLGATYSGSRRCWYLDYLRLLIICCVLIFRIWWWLLNLQFPIW